MEDLVEGKLLKFKLKDELKNIYMWIDKIIASWLISISIPMKNSKSHKTTLYFIYIYIMY